MKTLVIGFSRPTSPSLFAKSIMWVDKTNYDHVYVKWTWADIQRDIIYQASKLAVNFETNITFDAHAIPVEEYQVSIDDATHKTVMQFCMDNSDKPYGLMEILGFAYVKVVKMITKKVVHNPFPANGSTFVCSVLAANILNQIEPGKITEPMDDIDPLDFNNIVKAAGLKRIL